MPTVDSSGGVEVEDRGTVWSLRLNRPDKLNALDRGVRDLLERALAELENRPDVAAVVFSGAGRSFSAGADFTASPPGSDPSMGWKERRRDAGLWQRLLELLDRVPQVTIAALHGDCYGGAALLAVSCDIRIADESLRVRIPEVAMGIPLTWSGIPRLVREVGLPIARDLVITARVMSASDALGCGFVQRVVATGELESALDELVEDVTVMPSAPLAMTRAMFSAISREQLSQTGWSDPDLLAWSLREPDSVAAAIEYINGKRR